MIEVFTFDGCYVSALVFGALADSTIRRANPISASLPEDFALWCGSASEKC
jgi:hypothetical protein